MSNLATPDVHQIDSFGHKRFLDPDRPVGWESRKSYKAKIANGFFAKYLSGTTILEIGYKGGVEGTVPIVPQAIGIDLDYPGYDGIRLPFPDESQDAVYSSHCLEHILDYQNALREWYRVLKIGGYLIIVVPHQYLYERRHALPSRWNRDHKRFYTPASLLREVEQAFEPNSYRIRHLADNDLGFNYSRTPNQGAVGCTEFELVIEKRYTPSWSLDDGTVRTYNAGEFSTNLENTQPWRRLKGNPFFLETDFTVTDTCIIWGPYVPLAAGNYEANFFFQAVGVGDRPLESRIIFDIGQNAEQIASISLGGSDGIRSLHEGSVRLPFSNKTPGAVFEFRLYTFGQPFSGKFIFLGVRLDWQQR